MENQPSTLRRIPLPDAREFEHDYMHSVTPVVIADLFRDNRIRNINTPQRVSAQWGDVRIPVQNEYLKTYEAFTQGKSKLEDKDASLDDMTTMTLDEYFRYIHEQPGEKKMCIEFATPQPIRESYIIPELCYPRPGESNTLVQQCFVGNRGNVANIHFDKAGHHGLLYQVFGRKRFILFPHAAGKKLLPLTQTSGWKLQNFSEQERREFLQFTGGYEVVLAAGEAVYVPALYWHYADYIEDSMAVRLRFRRPDYITTLLNHLFPDLYTQGILHKLADPARARGEYAPVMDRIIQCATAHYTDGREKVAAVRALCKQIYFELYPEEPQQPYSLDLERYCPPLLSHFLDADHPDRPVYQ